MKNKSNESRKRKHSERKNNFTLKAERVHVITRSMQRVRRNQRTNHQTAVVGRKREGTAKTGKTETEGLGKEGTRRKEDSRVDRTQYCNNFNYGDTTDRRGVSGSLRSLAPTHPVPTPPRARPRFIHLYRRMTQTSRLNWLSEPKWGYL